MWAMLSDARNQALLHKIAALPRERQEQALPEMMHRVDGDTCGTLLEYVGLK